MEREILFRGRSCVSGLWYEGMPVRASEPPYRICAIEIPEKHARVQIDTETCGEYTGLTDKNGRRIFEGDILEASNGNRGHVVFENGAFMKLGYNEDIPFSIAADVNEVIGNIHDDPELLGGDNNA